jgi:hypothetical protein
MAVEPNKESGTRKTEYQSIFTGGFPSKRLFVAH